MQKHFADSPVHNIAQDSVLSRRRVSIIALVGIIMVITVSLALINMHGSSASTGHNSLSPHDEFSSGMPLP